VNVFIFPNVLRLTTRYHSDGGLVVIAESREQVAALISEEHPDEWSSIEKNHRIEITPEEWDDVQVFELMDNCEPRMFVFPNAGCC
jgi:hypothetical protein